MKLFGEYLKEHARLIAASVLAAAIFLASFALYGRADLRASGLGLYLCRRVCRKLGHEISAVSAPGKGTEIRIDLSSYDLDPE